MSSRMLIDARHAEETRVTVVKGSRVEEFDYESSTRRQLKGNIYLARVTRVEPSLQAAFVEYGGNRHGFLAFSEIHPDYYQIPAEDREAIIEAEVLAAREAQERRETRELAERERAEHRAKQKAQDNDGMSEDEKTDTNGSTEAISSTEDTSKPDERKDLNKVMSEPAISEDSVVKSEIIIDNASKAHHDNESDQINIFDSLPENESTDKDAIDISTGELDDSAAIQTDQDEDVTSDDDSDEAENDREVEEAAIRRRSIRALKRRYSIQEVIKRRQVLLIQVVKEERGNKGAALTTYMSLAGRYCVLMPNSTHSGGISRKIASVTDRKRLKKVINELNIPDEMGLIVRTAGMKRTKADIKRDYDYLLRLWNGIRELTLKSIAPTLVYEEGDLIKRTIRDLFTRDIDEILVEGNNGYNSAREFIKLLMPNHESKVQHYKDRIPLFHRYQVEGQLESMYQPTVQLKSGGYIVMNPTEALISIDVNSGRATKEHNIEETAVKTNLEAAEEIARQLRLRDMAGLVVIDFIDMEDRGNNRSVERRMKDVLKSDRARIQMGRISSFGLMEMSRQRLRPNLLEASMETCHHCEGIGLVRGVESAALMALRELEEEGIRSRSSIVRVSLNPDVAVYLLNKKRHQLYDLEQSYHLEIEVLALPTLSASGIEITREAMPPSDAKPVTNDTAISMNNFPETPEAEDSENTKDAVQAEEYSDDKPRRKRRRRRRRNNDRDQDQQRGSVSEDTSAARDVSNSGTQAEENLEAENTESRPNEEQPRRRGRRGGRHRSADTVDTNKPENKKTGPTVSETTETKSIEAKSMDEPSKAPEQKADEPIEKPKRRRQAKKSDTLDAAKPNNTATEKKDAQKPRRRRVKKVGPEEGSAPDISENSATSENSENSENSGTKDDMKAKPKPRRRTATKPATDSATDSTTDSTTDSGTKIQEAKPEEPARPKREGWWSRTFG